MLVHLFMHSDVAQISYLEEKIPNQIEKLRIDSSNSLQCVEITSTEMQQRTRGLYDPLTVLTKTEPHA